MSDLFDTEVPIEWFAEAWDKIEVCNRLAIQIVTKRISVVEKRLAAIGRASWPRHAGLMITVVNQAEADRDIPRLLALKGRFGIPWVGLSIEPMLGAIDLSGWLGQLDWVICGGESGGHARPMHPDWPRSLRDQCALAGVPFLFKQWGEFEDSGPAWGVSAGSAADLAGCVFVAKDGYLYNVRESATYDAWAMRRVGKKRAGRLLDGVEHNGFPSTRRAA
jgi:protein gp37